jgi:hypothetical protein
MERADRIADRATWVGLALAGLGLAIVIVRSWVEYLSVAPEHVPPEGLNIVDGYWIGHEPWSSMGVVPVLAGSLLATAAAATLVMLRGDWLRRLLALAVLVVPVLWWLIGLGALPYPRFVGPDPVTLAYSMPQQAAIMLLVPAVAAAALAFLPHRPDTRIRLKRVHPEQPTYR